MSSESLRILNDQNLLASTRKLVAMERRLATQIIRYLQEISDRRLYAKRGYSSLFDFCIKDLGYSEVSAYLKISAIKLIDEIPEIEDKIQSGALSLSNIAQAQTFFRREKKDLNKSYSPEEKRDLLAQLENKTRKQATQILAEKSPSSVRTPDKIKPLSETNIEISFTASRELMAKLERIQEIESHSLNETDYNTLFLHMAELVLKQRDPLLKKSKPKRTQAATATKSLTSSSPQKERNLGANSPRITMTAQQKRSDVDNKEVRSALRTANQGDNQTDFLNSPNEFVPPSQSGSNTKGARSARVPTITQSFAAARTNNKNSARYIPAPLRREIWLRDKGQCTFIDPLTQQSCGSRHRIQVDHIIPVALGGQSEPDNLRLLCRSHNQLEALNKLGSQTMSQFLN